jgi:hypothetical protein
MATRQSLLQNKIRESPVETKNYKNGPMAQMIQELSI